MISKIAASWQHPASWQIALAQAVRDPARLLQQLDLPMDLLPAALAAARLFPLRVPQSYVRRIKPGDPHDPLLRQVLPLAAEFTAVIASAGISPMPTPTPCTSIGRPPSLTCAATRT